MARFLHKPGTFEQYGTKTAIRPEQRSDRHLPSFAKARILSERALVP